LFVLRNAKYFVESYDEYENLQHKINNCISSTKRSLEYGIFDSVEEIEEDFEI
jgi:hypothetical protein